MDDVARVTSDPAVEAAPTYRPHIEALHARPLA
jgi:hypothetical protein